MGLFDKVRVLLTGKTPVEQLAEVQARIAAATSRRDAADRQIDELALAVLRGDQQAASRSADLERERETAGAELEALRRGETQLAVAVAAAAEATRQAALEAWPAELAALREQKLALADQIEDQLTALRTTVGDYIGVGETLAVKSGSPALRRYEQTIASRLTAVIARRFMIRERHSGTAVENLLGLTNPFTKPQNEWSLSQFDQTSFDNLLPLYSTEEAAAAAKDRLAQLGSETIIRRIGDVWELTRREDLFLDRPAAERAAGAAARTGRERVVRPYGRGYRVLERQIAEVEDAIAATPAPAA